MTFSVANGFLFKSFPYENSGDDAIDPTFIVAVTATLVAVAFFATFLPALRASRVHPVRALQAESRTGHAAILSGWHELAMKVMLHFPRHILEMPIHWQLWIALLFLTNMAAVFFLPRVEASVVLAGLFVGALRQMVIFARFGFVRLLGLGHFHWFVMIAWLVNRLASIRGEGLFYNWVVAVITLCGLSLVIDTVDVVRYLRGERKPTIVREA